MPARWVRLFWLHWLATAVAQGEVPPEATAFGVNLAGAEFGALPGRHGWEYRYPEEADFEALHRRGVKVIRLPFRWERLQPEVGGAWDAAELARLDGAIAHARARRQRLLLDLHNYGKHRGRLIGSPEVPREAFADFWRRLAERYAREEAVFAYGLMNEPAAGPGGWRAAAQAAVEAIRQVDRRHTLSVCGVNWSGAHSWRKSNADFLLHDPASNLVYEAHAYFDHDHSGRYARSYEDGAAHPQLGVARLRPFVEWLAEHGARGFIGEFGVPQDDPRWLEVLHHALEYLREHRIGGTQWAAGSLWGDYPLSLQPRREGRDPPALAVLLRFAAPGAAHPAPAYLGAADRWRAAGQRLLFNFRSRAESYHFKNAETELARASGVDAEGWGTRVYTFRHRGQPAYLGLGLYVDALRVAPHQALVLRARADRPTRLTAKLVLKDRRSFSAAVEVGVDWADLRLAVADFVGEGGRLDPTQPVEKIEWSPAPAPAGNRMEFSTLLLSR
jgi:endoglucanase